MSDLVTCTADVPGHGWAKSYGRRFNASSHDTLRWRHAGWLEESSPGAWGTTVVGS